MGSIDFGWIRAESPRFAWNLDVNRTINGHGEKVHLSVRSSSGFRWPRRQNCWTVNAQCNFKFNFNNLINFFSPSDLGTGPGTIHDEEQFVWKIAHSWIAPLLVPFNWFGLANSASAVLYGTDCSGARTRRWAKECFWPRLWLSRISMSRMGLQWRENETVSHSPETSPSLANPVHGAPSLTTYASNSLGSHGHYYY